MIFLTIKIIEGEDKMKGRKIVSLLLALTLIMATLPVQVFAKEKVGVGAPILQGLETQETTPAAIQITPSKYVGDGYEVEFKVVSQWEGKFDGEIILTNTGDKVIESWALEFDFKHTIASIWNAQLISNEDGYTFKNLGWNKDIKPGATVSIGFGAGQDGQILAPQKYDLVTSKQNVADQDYTIDFKIGSDWGQGFNGEISITNNTEEVIEDWVLEFDFDRNIQSFWTAEIAEHIEDHYIIKNARYNANIKPGETIKLGFAGTPGDVNSEPKNFVLKQVGREVDYEKDSDGDGLPDWFEKEIGTDPHKEDTDEDGLPDGYEYFTLNSDPLKKDTDGNGIDDGDEDFDGDGLTNLQEYKLGTDPHNKDTDFDGLNDYDEVYIYGTDPLEYDTDEDGLSDSKEIELGTDPLNPDTNDNGILDGDEIYTIEKTPDIEFSDENVIPTVTIDVAGRLIDSLDIFALSEDNLYLPSEMPGYIGAGYEFELSGEFEEATLTFTFNTDLLEKEDFEPAIYYYDEEEQFMEYLDQQEIDWDNHTVSTKINHFSKYILIDDKEYQKAWEEEIRVPWDNELHKPLDIALVIDSSGSMRSNDPKGIRKQATKELVDSLANNDRVSVVDFDSRAYLLTPFTNNKDKAKAAIDKVDSSGGTSLTAGIKMALEQFTKAPDKGYEHRDSLKYIIMLTDGDGPYDKNLTKLARDNNVIIFTVGLGSGVKTTLLREIATETLGKHFFATSAEGLIEEFEDIKGEVIDLKTDTDEDGLPDYFEKRLRYSNGIRINTNRFKPDTDGDTVKDGDEIEIRVKETKYFGQPIVRVYAKMHSHPLMKDTDGDGYDDDKDRNPLKWDISSRDLVMASSISYSYIPKGSNFDKLSSYWKNELNRNFKKLAYTDELKGWRVIDTCYASAGLQALALKKDGNIVIAYRGTANTFGTEYVKDWSNNIAAYIKGVGPQTAGAKKFIKKTMKNNKESIFYITGHSLGGHLAYLSGAEGLKYDNTRMKGITTFNGLGLTLTGTMNDLDDSYELSRFKSKINDYVVNGDPVYNIPGTYHYGTKKTYDKSESAPKEHNLDTFLEVLEPLGRKDSYM